jgi:hypothetical protein
LELDPEGEHRRVFEPADHPVDFALAVDGVGIFAQGELGVGFGFEDEGAGGLGRVLIGGGESGEGAGEMGEGVLDDAFDEGGEGDAGFAEETTEIGRRDGREGLSEFSGAGRANGLAGGGR